MPSVFFLSHTETKLQKHVFFCPLTILLTLSVLLYHLRSQGVSRDLQGANLPPRGGVEADRVILAGRGPELESQYLPP